MKPIFYILDERNVWHEAIADAARKRGFYPQRIRHGHEVERDDYGYDWGFIRPHATPDILKRNQTVDAPQMFQRLNMVQDMAQVQYYEDKIGQAYAFEEWLPRTWFFDNKEDARDFVAVCDFPVVSKAAVGASSANVRIIGEPGELRTHIRDIFERGIKVYHRDSKGTTSLQKGYVLLQEFIPHDVTYRVNIIGNGRAVFKRYNYDDRPVAQTGNVEPMMEEWPELLEFADRVAAAIDTRWCALDILQRPTGEFVLLETSLAWPWPSPGKCNEAPIFRTPYKWTELFDCMFEEIVCGST